MIATMRYYWPVWLAAGLSTGLGGTALFMLGWALGDG